MIYLVDKLLVRFQGQDAVETTKSRITATELSQTADDGSVDRVSPPPEHTALKSQELSQEMSVASPGVTTPPATINTSSDKHESVDPMSESHHVTVPEPSSLSEEEDEYSGLERDGDDEFDPRSVGIDSPRSHCSSRTEYICSFEGCSAIFSRPSRLKCHVRVHTGEVSVHGYQ